MQKALDILGESIIKLKSADDDLTPEDKELAIYYLERIAELQAFFQIAQLALNTILGSDESLDFESVTKIEIG